MTLKTSPKFKRNVSRILPFGLIWLGTSWVFLAYDFTLTRNQNLNPDTDITLTTPVLIFANTLITVIGLLVGTLEMILLEKRFKNFRLIEKILAKLFLYLLLMLALILIAYLIAASIESSLPPNHPQILSKTGRFLNSLTFINTLLQLAFFLALSLAYSAISENLGHNVLRNLFMGKYHSPKVEQRIFMFLDMKKSTTIAEKLGHVKYFKLLQDYYEMMSDAIINSKGEVYQYIGDEVVITWKEKDGFDQNNCITCFIAIKHKLEERSDFFISQYGHLPDFKAGIHVGEVTTGEIGALKKEIVYSGDVLNTAARIQALYKTYNSDLIVSKQVLNGLVDPSSLCTKNLGEIPLKGKTNMIDLYAIIS